MDLDLKNKEWKEFKLSDLFLIEHCKCTKVTDLQKGNMPYVGATNRNNGVLSFVKPIKKLITKGNCIAFICDGEGSVGYAIYKEEDFIGSTTVKVGRNEKLNKYNAHFIITIADTVRSKYNFGFKRNEFHLKNETLILPVNSQVEPDYEYMDQYMRQKEQEKYNVYKSYIAKRIKKLGNVRETVTLNEKEWGEFYIRDIFTNIQRGKRFKKLDHKKGKMPYVSSTAINNGVDGYVVNEKKLRIFTNCLTLANSGSVGACFYQPFEFVASDHITKLENTNLTYFVMLFISCLISRLSEKYSFNREINDKRIKREKILLPINEIQEPDYEYMEQYMKALEYKNLKYYLELKS